MSWFWYAILIYIALRFVWILLEIIIMERTFWRSPGVPVKRKLNSKDLNLMKQIKEARPDLGLAHYTYLLQGAKGVDFVSRDYVRRLLNEIGK